MSTGTQRTEPTAGRASAERTAKSGKDTSATQKGVQEQVDGLRKIAESAAKAAAARRANIPKGATPQPSSTSLPKKRHGRYEINNDELFGAQNRRPLSLLDERTHNLETIEVTSVRFRERDANDSTVFEAVLYRDPATFDAHMLTLGAQELSNVYLIIVGSTQAKSNKAYGYVQKGNLAVAGA